ncbi:TPA: hypothetical protein PFE28_004210, partial [Kluyvera cryocrescens]|nr:hypothetical protein [Kluyvera cryocrescens]
MKRNILILGFLFSATSFAGPYADIAKAKFESAMLEALQATNADHKKVSAGMSQLP